MAQETTLDRDTLVVRTGDEAEVDDNFDRVSFEPAYKRALAACERRRLWRPCGKTSRTTRHRYPRQRS